MNELRRFCIGEDIIFYPEHFSLNNLCQNELVGHPAIRLCQAFIREKRKYAKKTEMESLVCENRQLKYTDY